MEGIPSRLVRGLVGRNRSERRLLFLLFPVVFALLAVGSVVDGIGYFGWGCAGIEGYDYRALNPLFYLPYALAHPNSCFGFPVGTSPDLAHYVGSALDLYLWTIAWWVALAYIVSRSAAAIRQHPAFAPIPQDPG